MGTRGWDHEVDLLVVGSGAGGMTSAVVAHDLGLQALVLEKSEYFGGSSSMSGGAVWAPGHHVAGGNGTRDRREDVLAYLRAAAAGLVAESKLQAFVEAAPQAIEHLQTRTRVRFSVGKMFFDYYRDAPGATTGVRSLVPVPFNGRELGCERKHVRPLHPSLVLLGTVQMFDTADQGWALVRGSSRMARLRVVARFGKYLLKPTVLLGVRRDTRLVLGNALVGRLRRSLMDRDVPLWRCCAAQKLVLDGDRVVGLVARRGDDVLRIRATRGVVLASGGFDRNDAMRREVSPPWLGSYWSTGNPQNTGDGLTMGVQAGGGAEHLDATLWLPVMRGPEEGFPRLLAQFNSLPGSIVVNRRGARFLNDGQPYERLAREIYESYRGGAECVPSYLVFDSRYVRRYAVLRPLVYWVSKGFLQRDATLRGLADQLGIDGATLEATVARFNDHARRGTDEDFGRGASVTDREWGDATVRPNPSMAPLETPPYYAVAIYPGDVGTIGGLTTDASARVLRPGGAPVPGLYAIGNCAAAVTGRAYPAPGSTIGPALTFGYLAAHHAAS